MWMRQWVWMKWLYFKAPEGSNEVILKVYYKEIEDGKHEEITEEDFFNIKNQYATVAEELEWKKLEGFWSPEDIK